VGLLLADVELGLFPTQMALSSKGMGKAAWSCLKFNV